MGIHFKNTHSVRMPAGRKRALIVSHADEHIPGILLICQNTGPYFSLIRTLSIDYVVTVCSRFEGVREQIANQVFDLFIIEYSANDHLVLQMLELCRPAMQRGARVILIDGNPGKEFIAAAFAHGLCDYFPEPVQEALLVERVQSLLTKAE